jgi:hypothetical protein|nr:hypothetical protein [Kofleriaceae bacterium]
MRIMASLAVVTVLATGCAFGRTVNAPAVNPPRIATDTPTSGLVVSDFYQGKHEVSQTGSTDIVILRESMEVKDISTDIAGAFASAGMPSKGVVHGDPAKLQPGQLLLRGTLQEVGNSHGGFIAGVVITSITLFAIGGILPYPVPLPYDCQFKYKYQLVAPSGDIVATGEHVVTIDYKTLFVGGFWGGNFRGCTNDFDRNTSDVQGILVREVLASIGTATAAAPVARE